MQNDSVKQVLDPVRAAVNLGWVAVSYFRKSPSWLYNKLHGRIVNGKPACFTAAEVSLLADALTDLSGQIQDAAGKLRDISR